LRVVGHRANTVSWLRRLARCSDAVEIDVISTDGGFYATHSVVWRYGSPILLREKLARMLESLHLKPPTPLEKLIASLPEGMPVFLDLKTPINGDSIRALRRIVGKRRAYIVTRWHNIAQLAAAYGFRVLLSIASRPANPALLVERSGAHGLSIEAAYADGELVGELHSRGFEVAVWTVNSLEAAAAMEALGVDWLVTDVPCSIRGRTETVPRGV
jgi:hypothetical protein